MQGGDSPDPFGMDYVDTDIEEVSDEPGVYSESSDSVSYCLLQSLDYKPITELLKDWIDESWI